MSKKATNFFGDVLNVNVVFIAFSVLLFGLLRLPSVIEPYWYGDEGIYQVIGIALNHGRILYQGIWDNKPPLLYVIYAIFNGDQFLVRLASLVFGALSVYFIYLLANKIFKSSVSAYISTLFFAIIFGLPIIEGNIANAENFMLLPIIMGFYFIAESSEKRKTFNTVVAGILLSLAALTKIVAIFDLAALSFFIISMRFYETIKFDAAGIIRELKQAISGVEQEAVLIGSFLVPIIITVIYFLSVGALPDFLHAAFSQNVGYVGYGNYFLFPMGLLVLKLVILALCIILTFVFRKSLGKSGVLIFGWVFFASFDSFFSARPYTHYLLMLLPAFSLLLGYVWENKKLSIVSIIILLGLYFLINRNFSFYKKIGPYYSNYISFISGNKSVNDYQSFFDNNTPKDYEIANFIEVSTSPSDNVFLWGDGAQIYALSGKLPPGRYTVAYHISQNQAAIDETKRAINTVKPKYIIQIKNDPVIKNFLDNYELRYKIDGATVYEKKS